MRKLLTILFIVSTNILTAAIIQSINKVTGYYDYRDGILITAAHIPPSNLKLGLKLLHTDEKLDIAYYLDPYHRRVKHKLQTVKIDGLINARIVDSSEGYFYVECDNPENIVRGMSGQHVYDKNGVVVGFVSALESNKRLYCVAIE